jgi:hypothetical protein
MHQSPNIWKDWDTPRDLILMGHPMSKFALIENTPGEAIFSKDEF